jgi:hypothetical protein
MLFYILLPAHLLKKSKPDKSAYLSSLAELLNFVWCVFFKYNFDKI